MNILEPYVPTETRLFWRDLTCSVRDHNVLLIMESYTVSKLTVQYRNFISGYDWELSFGRVAASNQFVRNTRAGGKVNGKVLKGGNITQAGR